MMQTNSFSVSAVTLIDRQVCKVAAYIECVKFYSQVSDQAATLSHLAC